MERGAIISADPGIEISSLGWLHDVFHAFQYPPPPPAGDGAPGFVDVLTYAASRTDLVDTVVIPPRTDVTTTRATTLLQVLLRRWYHLFWTLHNYGYSLGGNFGVSNFLINASSSVIRVTGAVRITWLCRATGGSDHRALARAIEEFLTVREHVPPAIQAWLHLMNTDAYGNEYIIRYSISLMEPRQAFAYLMSTRRTMLRLPTLNTDMFRMLMHACSTYNLWRTQRTGTGCINACMQESFIFGLQFGNLLDDVSGVLTLFRNCSEHPAFHYEAYLILILEQDFPGFAADFQRAMFRCSQLPLLHEFVQSTMA